MASTKDSKHVEIHKDIHKILSMMKVEMEMKNVSEVLQYLLDNQKD